MVFTITVGMLSPLLNGGKSAPARSPAAPAGPPAATGESAPSKAVLKLNQQTADRLQALSDLKRDLRAGKKTAIGDAKGRAREKLNQLMERLKLIRKLYADDPKQMARQMAALAKEMKGLVKDYAAAAKASGELFSEDLKTPPDPAAPPEAQAAARKEIEDQAKMEIQGDMEFIKLVRGAGQALKDELEKAKIKGVLTLPGKFEQSDDYKEARDGLKDLDTALDDMDQQIRHDMPPGSLMTLAA